MNHTPSLWSFIANAGPLVKSVMLILLSTSIISWTIVFQKLLSIRNYAYAIEKFERHFWSFDNLGDFYTKLRVRKKDLQGLEKIFFAGFSEYFKLRKQSNINNEDIIQSTTRAMEIAITKELIPLEKHLSLLATIGSISPYIGLFGTVWGIMTSFRALGRTQQATIAMVAPGISEALIATAMGLFSAIPAVIAYNYCAAKIGQIENTYNVFREEFLSIIHHQITQDVIS